MPSTPTVAAGPGARRPSGDPARLFLSPFAVYALTISRTLWTTDVFGANLDLVAHHRVTGSPWIDGARIPSWVTARQLARDRPDAQRAHGLRTVPGVIAAALPAYACPGSAPSPPCRAGLTAALLMAWRWSLMFLALRRYLPGRQALIAAAVFGFATPVWTVSANLMWPHTITVFAIAGMAWAAASDRWWWAGVFGGIGLWGGPMSPSSWPCSGLGVALRRRDRAPASGWRHQRRIPGWPTACGSTGCTARGTPWAPTTAATVERHADQYRFSFVNQLGMWVAPDRGILLWTPLVLLLLPALVRSWRELPGLVALPAAGRSGLHRPRRRPEHLHRRRRLLRLPLRPRVPGLRHARARPVTRRMGRRGAGLPRSRDRRPGSSPFLLGAVDDNVVPPSPPPGTTTRSCTRSTRSALSRGWRRRSRGAADSWWPGGSPASRQCRRRAGAPPVGQVPA